MTCRLSFPMVLSALAVVVAANPATAEITAERSKKGVVVKIDGKLFTEYLTDFKGTPILWPDIGPTDKPITRAYPMAKGPGEREDHQHHRSLWFTHGGVGGTSFWEIGRGTIKHREFVKIESGKIAELVTRNDWLSQKGEKVCEDQRNLAFGSDGRSRWIDFEIAIKASDGPLKFVDTKEGTMGVRVAGTMKVDAKKGGRIVNSQGQTDGGAWGKRAAWVDYHGPVEGQTVGIAILNHPSSFRFPTYWHVRTYGLFAANPFGIKDFERDREADGSHTLSAGATLRLRYRVLFHLGDEKTGKVAESFEAYAKQEK